jgi:hypothetical protein
LSVVVFAVGQHGEPLALTHTGIHGAVLLVDTDDVESEDLATIGDVAELAGLSVATVYRAAQLRVGMERVARWPV